MPKSQLPSKSQACSAFGQTVRKLRLKAGLSQEKLARELKIDRGNLSATELGRHNPTMLTICRLVPGLRVSITEFFTEYERNLPPHLRPGPRRNLRA